MICCEKYPECDLDRCIDCLQLRLDARLREPVWYFGLGGRYISGDANANTVDDPGDDPGDDPCD